MDGADSSSTHGLEVTAVQLELEGVELANDHQPLAKVPAADVVLQARATFAPPPRLLVSEFAQQELIVPTGPMQGANWDNGFMPYQAGIMDAFFEDGIEVVALKASSQVGKTSAALVLVAYHVVHDPCPIMVVQPTVDPMAKDFSQNRLDPIIRASPALADTFATKRAKDSHNTTYQKTFRGGSLSIAGANSAASLAARSIRALFLDEIDRYPPELPGEGNTIAIAMKRTTAYGGRRRVSLYSSPTIKGAPIDDFYHRGDQRRYYVPCPGCGFMHPYRWQNVKWTNDDPDTARLQCPECDYPIYDAERIAQLTKGEWRAENPDRPERELASFHLWEAYSPVSSLRTIVADFLKARKAQKAGDKSLMHTWQNTSLGEAVSPEGGEQVEPDSLLARRESYGPDNVAAPGGVAAITAGIDVQDDRLEALVVGWGPGEESWIIDHQVLPGDTSQPEPWKLLDEVLQTEYLHGTGQRLGVLSSCIDSGGHRTNEVYAYAARMAARRCWAIIGRAGDRPLVSAPARKRHGRERRKVPLYTVGVDAAKSIWFDRLRLEQPGPGYVHLPIADWANQELADQLASERQETKYSKGVPVRVWVQTRARNEALDMAVYSLAALRLAHPDLYLLHERLHAAARGAPPPSSSPPPQPTGGGFLGGRRRGWLR